MTKRLEMTDALRARIAQAAGPEVDVSKLAAYEAVVANTMPLDKRGSLFHKGQIDAGLLAEMAGVPAKGGVPLHNLHMQGMELPVGKVFHAALIQNDAGNPELRAQFYVPLSEVDLVSKLDTGVVDETSVGVRSKQILCAKCGYDYAAPGASLMCILNQTCPDDHTVGEDGNHVQLKGLDRWLELSLVSRGASDRPKIVGRTKALLGDGHYGELIASGVSPEATTVFATATKESPMTVDVNKLVADLSTSAANLALEQNKVTVLTGERDALKTQLEAATAKVTALEAAATEPAKALGVAQTEITALKAAAEETVAFLTAQLKASLVAEGKTVEDDKLPKDAKGLVEALKASTDSVHKLIPVGGRAAPARSGTETDMKATGAHSAFKVK